MEEVFLSEEIDEDQEKVGNKLLGMICVIGAVQKI